MDTLQRFFPTKVHSIVLSIFAALSLMLSWPLLPRIFTHVPGIAQWAFDESTFIWNIWTLKYSLIDNLQSPLHSELIYYPLGIDLVLYTYNFFHALIAQPLYLAFNLPFGSNTSLLLSTILSGYGTFLLLLYLLRRKGQETKRLSVAYEKRTHAATLRSPIYLSAIVAGIVYAFATNRAVYAALGHYDMVTTQWIPFYALALLRSLDEGLSAPKRRKAAAFAGLFFAFNGLAEMITAVFLAIFTIIVVLTWVINNRRTKAQEAGTKGISHDRPSSRNLAARLPTHLVTLSSSLLIIGIVAFALWSPVLIPILAQFLTDDFSLAGWGEAIPLSTDLLGWIMPTVIHPILGGDLVARLREVQEIKLIPGNEMMAVGFRDINTVFLGWMTLTLAIVGALAWWKEVRIWVWTSIVFGLFTLGPFLQVNGRYIYDFDGVNSAIPMPFAILHYIPIVRANRAPNRNSVLLMLGLAVLVGYGVYWLYQRFVNRESRRDGTSQTEHSSHWPLHASLAIALSLLIIFEHLTIPLPHSDARVPEVYEIIAADPAPVSVMHMPLGWRNSFGTYGPERTLLQYYQSTHGKAMLGGNISRAPDFKKDYFRRIPFFEALTSVGTIYPLDESLQAELAQQAATQADELLYLYNVGYVLLMPPIEERYPYANTWENSWQMAKETLPLEDEPFWTGDGIEAYRVIQPAGDDSFTVDLGETGTFPYRGEGWDGAEIDAPYDTTAIWATDETSRIFIPLREVDPAATYEVRTRIHSLTQPQSVMLEVNGEAFDEQSVGDGWQEISWTVPGSALQNSINTLTFQWQQTTPVCQVNPAECFVGDTGLATPIDLELNGFAEGGFIALFDSEGNQIDASTGRRGVNVTVLDEQSGEVIEMAGFDTAANEFESAQLSEFLNEIPDGRLVLVTTRGDAFAYLTLDAVAALQALGADVTLEELQGNYFSIAGVQGAEVGQAEVVVNGDGAYLGLRPDRRSLAAAVDWVAVEQLKD